MALSDEEIARIKATRERTGNVVSKDPLVAVFYDLLKCHVLPGDLEQVIIDAETCKGEEFHFTNGYLANYAKDIVARLRGLPYE